MNWKNGLQKQVKNASGPTRRKVLTGGLGLAAASALASPSVLIPGRARAATQVVVASYGGTYGEALDTAFFRPFTEETGVAVVQTGAADLAKLKAQVMTDTVEWDIIETLPTEVITASREGLIQPIDYSIVEFDESDLIYAEAKQPNWVTVFNYTGGIAYNKENHPEGKHPTTWPEFWDAEKFPGRRGLRSRPNDTLEIAMLAAGTEPKDVYPIDVERAFSILDEVKPHIDNWIDTAPQTVQLIQTGELDFTYTFHNRIVAANKSGIPLGFSPEQLLIFFNTFSVPKGARNTKEAMQLLDFMMRPDRQAVLCQEVGSLPIMKSAMDMISDEFKSAWVPDMSNPNHLLINAEWWGEPGRFAELTTRFRNWLLT